MGDRSNIVVKEGAHKPAHTPGPWTACNKGSGTPDRFVCDIRGDTIAYCHRTIEEAKANAHLIAAAPELLAALELMTRAYESVLPGIKYIAVQDYALLNDAPIAAAAAIKQARGEA